jgi:hypothetical protein
MNGSILKTFFLMFDSDASGLKKGAEEAKTAINRTKDELNVLDKVGERVGEGFLNFANQAKQLLLSLASIGVLAAAAKQAEEYVTELDKASKEIGINASELQKWQRVVASGGGSVDGFTGSLQHISEELVKFKSGLGSESIMMLRYIGVHFRDAKGHAKSFLEVLPELADRLSGMTRARGLTIGQRLGLDTQTILLLQKGRKNLEELMSKQKEMSLVKQQDIEITEKFNAQWAELSFEFRSLFISANSYILPVLTSIFKSIENVIQYLQSHKNVAVGFFAAIGAAITRILLPPLLTALSSAAALAAPFIAAAAAITAVSAAFSLLYDDVINFREGNDSVIGEMTKKWPLVGVVVNKVVDVLLILKDVFIGLASVIYDLITFNILKAWEDLENTFKTGIKRLEKEFPVLIPLIERIGDVFLVVSKIVQNAWDSVLFVVKKVFGFIEAAIEKMISAYSKVKGVFSKDAKIQATIEPAGCGDGDKHSFN